MIDTHCGLRNELAAQEQSVGVYGLAWVHSKSKLLQRSHIEFVQQLNGLPKLCVPPPTETLRRRLK